MVEITHHLDGPADVSTIGRFRLLKPLSPVGSSSFEGGWGVHYSDI